MEKENTFSIQIFRYSVLVFRFSAYFLRNLLISSRAIKCFVFFFFLFSKWEFEH